MEHEFDKIRKKISEAEEGPITWQKEYVWSKISYGSNKRTLVFYYSAASLILACAIILYSIETTRQRKLDLQLRQAELSIEQMKTLQSSLQQGSVIQIDCPDTEKTTIAKSPVPRKTRIPETTLQKIKTTERKDEILYEEKFKTPEGAVAIVPEKKNETSVPETVIVRHPSRSIQPIIGGREPIVQAKGKKLQFRLFPSEENTESVPAAAETISFHSKIN